MADGLGSHTSRCLNQPFCAEKPPEAIVRRSGFRGKEEFATIARKLLTGSSEWGKLFRVT
jgi:hypothetical protein